MRRVTEQSLQNSALFYLRRYSASVAHLRRVLKRKVARSLKASGDEAPEADAWIDALLARFVKTGYLDDAKLATLRTASLRRAGKSTRVIRGTLRLKGVPADLVQSATEGGSSADAEAVWELARRKKLGVYRAAATRADRRQKDLAALARAGFSYELAKRVVDAKEPR